MSVLGTKRKYSIPSANFHSCIAGSMDRCNICNHTPSQKIRDFCSRAIVKRPIVSLNGLKIVCRMDWLCSRKQTIIAADCAPPIPLSGGIQQELMRHTCKVRIFSNIESLKCLVSDILPRSTTNGLLPKKDISNGNYRMNGQVKLKFTVVRFHGQPVRLELQRLISLT